MLCNENEKLRESHKTLQTSLIQGNNLNMKILRINIYRGVCDAYVFNSHIGNINFMFARKCKANV